MFEKLPRLQCALALAFGLSMLCAPPIGAQSAGTGALGGTLTDTSGSTFRRRRN